MKHESREASHKQRQNFSDPPRIASGQYIKYAWLSVVRWSDHKQGFTTALQLSLLYLNSFDSVSIVYYPIWTILMMKSFVLKYLTALHFADSRPISNYIYCLHTTELLAQLDLGISINFDIFHLNFLFKKCDFVLN